VATAQEMRRARAPVDRPRRARRPAWLAAVTAIASWAAVAAGPRPAGADADPETGAADLVTGRAVGPVALPPAPDGFVDETAGPFRWEYPRVARDEVRTLISRAPDSFDRIADELGGDLDPTVRIRVGAGPDDMRRLAPPGAPPPRYAVGVAYPALGLVLLTLTAPGSWEAPDLPRVLDHELSHIALFRRAGGRTRALPRWFVEGVAIHQAREHTIDRIRTLGQAAFGRGPIPWDRLSGAFPARPHRVDLAYAQSADMVAYLRRGDDGERRFRKVVGRVAQGMTFPDAVARTYLAPLSVLEREWRADLRQRFRLWPAGLTGGLLGLAALVLVVMGVFRRRRKARPVLERWAEEDALLDALEATHEEAAARRSAEAEGAAPKKTPRGRTTGGEDGAAGGGGRRDPDDDDDATPPRVPPGHPTTRGVDGTGVPKVRIDGRIHTLH